jgi:long-chain acyl-CoA synthetase
MNVGCFLTAAAERHPNRPAIVYGDQVLSYAEANAQANSLAAGLLRLGLQRGDRVAVLMWNCPQLLLSYFATWKAGGCVVPLNARFVAEEVAYHVNDCSASTVIFGEEFSGMMSELRPRLPSLKNLICTVEPAPGQIAYGELVDQCAGDLDPSFDTGDDEIAWIFYTSGTTGRPKGAMLSHGNLTFAAVGWIADLMGLEPEDIGLHAAPLTHGAGFHALALALKASAQVILKARRFDARLFCSTVAACGVTNTWLVPTQIKMLLKLEDLESYDLSSLKWVLYGGAPMYEADLKEALRRMGPVFVQLFGQGETPMTATYLRRQEHVLQGPESKHLVSCGHARSGIEVRILDESNCERRRGEVGEICVRGPSVMKGYWQRPDATAEVLRDGWLHTGDLGSMDDHGYVYILDRCRDLIISGGENIYPREIEEVLLRHPAVAEACVVGVPDEFWGEAVKGFVVLRPGMAVTAEDLIAFTGQHLAAYKKPKSVEFVAELPKSAYGKVLKRQLRDPYWALQARKV